MKLARIQWNNLESMECRIGNARLVIVTEFGPRISFFGKDGGRNLLFWDEEDRSRGDWKLRGGHRVWIMTPGADESEMTYRPDNGSCSVEENGKTVTVWGQVDPADKARRGIRVEETEAGDFAVSSLVRNDGEMLMSCGIWTLTCTLPAEDTAYGFPLGDGSGWDTFKSVQFRQWGPCDGSFGDEQFHVGAETLSIRPEGRQAKMMFCIPEGFGCMADPVSDSTFVKHVPFDPAGQYPEGCNWALYIGPENYMVEFETMGTFTTLKPGEGKAHQEIWSLTAGSVDVQNRTEIMMRQPGSN